MELPEEVVCNQFECGKRVLALGLCSMHYSRKYRHDTLTAPGPQVAWNKGLKTGLAPWRGKKRGPHSEATKAKMSAAQIGRPKSPEHAANIAKARTGIKRSLQTVMKMSASMKLSVARRGFSLEERARRSARFKGPLNPAFGKTPMHGPRTHWVTYNGVKLRSSYEVVLAKGFDAMGIKWIYEPQRFDLGECSYLPDFYLPELGVYWEAKGWLDPESRRRIRLFRKLNPDKPLVVASTFVIDQWRKLA